MKGILDGRNARWLWTATAALVVVASFWSSAVTSFRVLALWIVALFLLGQWGRRHLGETLQALLAGLVGVGIVHLVVFPAGGQPPVATAIKIVLLLAALWAGVGPMLLKRAGSPGGLSHPAPGSEAGTLWPFVVALFLSAVVLVYYAFNFSAARSALGAALLALLAPPCYVALFGRMAVDGFDPVSRVLVRRLLLIAPLGVGVVAATQFSMMKRSTRRATDFADLNDNESALRYNAKSLAFNRRLRLRGANERLLLQQARILDALGEPAQALASLLERSRNGYWPPDAPLVRALCKDYFTTASLTAQMQTLSHPRYVAFFDQVPLPSDPDERLLLLGLFARQGLLDRLLIEYSRCRFDEAFDWRYLRECIDNRRPGEEMNEIWATYLLGVCDARQPTRRNSARRQFQRVLDAWPEHHNALVWLDRLQGARRRRDGATAQPRTGRIDHAQMLGDHRWGLNLNDALWTAVELRPGRYALHFEAKGLPAEGEWPMLEVRLDDEVVLEKPVTSQDRWIDLTCEVAFEEDGCHRLVVGFTNDLYKEVGGKILNRNLYLRGIRVEKIGR